MRDRDTILLGEMYDNILEESIMSDPKLLIGEKVKIHPSVHKNYLWSVSHNNVVVFYANTIHLKDCTFPINHDRVNASVRNKQTGAIKGVNVWIFGEVVDIEFPESELNTNGFKPITYNPHKNPNYIYKDSSLPSWWCSDKRFSTSKDKAAIPARTQAMIEREKDPENLAAHVVASNNDTGIVTFTAQEMLGKQHIACDDYLWVKGVSH